MAVFRRRYRPYSGELTPENSRFLVLPRYSLSRLFDSKPFLAFFVVAFVPVLLGGTVIYLAHNMAVQALLNMQGQFRVQIDNFFFARWFMLQGAMAFLVTAWIGPGLLSMDLSHDALPLYLSRPFSRVDYVLGKAMVIAALLSSMTWVPGLFLFALNANLEAPGWLGSNLYIAFAIFAGSWIWIGILSLLALALSAWVKWRLAATGLMLAVFMVIPGFGEAVDEVLRTQWGKLLNLGYLMNRVWYDLFRLPYSGGRGRASVEQIPVWAAWLMLLAVCFFCLFLLNTRLKAREVVRG